MNHLDLFSGIGGFALATEMVWKDVTHTFCDNDPFSQAIIKKHWPHSHIHDDIKKLKGKEIKSTYILTGGFPCQPFSSAGKRRGTDDDRHLWPEMLRVIRESSPQWVIGENVSGLLTWDGGLVLERVLADLEAEGYEAWPFVIPACSQNAPHKRDRVWIVAHSNSRTNRRGTGRNASTSDTKGIRQRNAVGKFSESDQIRFPAYLASIRQRGGGIEEYRKSGRNLVTIKQERDSLRSKDERRDWNAWPEIAARLCIVDDGLPLGLARPRGWRNAALKGAGNAIVPQVAAEIMRVIKHVDPTFV